MPRTVPPSTERLALLALVLLGAALRLIDLDVAPGFSGDEGYEAFYGWQTAEFGTFQLHPVRPYLGPWFLWLMAPFIDVLGAGPMSARLPVALLGTAAVLLAGLVGRRLGGARVGLWAAALFATAPFAVLFSRLSLSVATTPFWVLLAMWLLLRLLERPSMMRGLGVGLAIGGAVSFHPQGLLLGPVTVVVAASLPQGRALVRKPAVLLAAAVGFCMLGWVVWDMVLDQVGLGPGIDYSGTWVGQQVSYSLPDRLMRSVPQVLDGLVGGRFLHWVSGPSFRDPPGELVGWVITAVIGALAVWSARDRALPRAAAAGLAVAWGLTVLRSADFDLGGLTRERYLLTTLTLAVPLLATAACGARAVLREIALLTLVLLNVGALGWGFFAPMTLGGGDAEPSFVAASPDAKVQASTWMRARLQPGEEGLLLAGDGWSYWPLVAVSGERFPADFVPEDAEECAAILARTDHRRRWLVDYPGWHWTAAIERCLAAAGVAGLPPAFVPLTVGGAPALHVWELAPGALRP